MSIATKNGSVIVKEGSIAEDCDCCVEDVCISSPLYLRMTVEGMPREIIGGESLGYAARSPHDDNGSEYTLYRNVESSIGTLASCTWRGGAHGHKNKVNAIYEQSGWTLDAANDRLYGYGFIFAPPENASFRKIPYEDERPVVVVGTYADEFGGDWSSVVVQIRSGRSSTPHPTCPDGQFGTVCAPQDCTPTDIVTPCSSKNWTPLTELSDLSLIVSVEALFSEKRLAGVPGIGNTQWEPLDPSTLINGTMGFLSGDYDLGWTTYSSITPYFFGVGAPAGWNLVSEGYRFFDIGSSLVQYLSQPFGYSWRPWLAIAVRPTAFVWEGQSPPTLTRCEDGCVSFGVNCMLFDTVYTYAGARPSEVVCGAYSPAQCAAYSCGQTPSLSVEMSGPIQVRLNKQSFGAWNELRGSVTFTVSTT